MNKWQNRKMKYFYKPNRNHDQRQHRGFHQPKVDKQLNLKNYKLMLQAQHVLGSNSSSGVKGHIDPSVSKNNVLWNFFHCVYTWNALVSQKKSSVFWNFPHCVYTWNAWPLVASLFISSASVKFTTQVFFCNTMHFAVPSFGIGSNHRVPIFSNST